MSRLALLSRWRRPQLCYLEPGTSFADWCKAHTGARCHLVVSPRLLHEMGFDTGLPLRDPAEREAYARQQFTHYFGSTAQRWPLATRAGGASALHGVDWADMQATARAHGVTLHRVEPFWAPLLRHLTQTANEKDRDFLQSPIAALAWVDGVLCSWITLANGELQSIRQLRLRDTSPAALDEALPQFDGPVRVIQAAPALLTSAGNEAPRVSFLPVRQRAPALAWGLLATSVAVLATAAWDAQQSYQTLRSTQQREASLLSRARPQAALPALQQKPSNKHDNSSDRQSQEVQALLQLPWEPVLTRVEQMGAKSQISWLSMDINAARKELRLDGVAPDKLLALQLADSLGEQRGWQQVMLGRLQQADAGMTGQRFDLSARFSGALAAQEAP